MDLQFNLNEPIFPALYGVFVVDEVAFLVIKLYKNWRRETCSYDTNY